MWKALVVGLLVLAGCASTQPEGVPEDRGARLEVNAEISVRTEQADAGKTQAFYESLGLSTTFTTVSERGPVVALDVSDGESRFRILFVPRDALFMDPFEPFMDPSPRTPDFPDYRVTWTIRVDADRFEQLRGREGTRLDRLPDGRESIAARDPAGLGLQVLVR